jgi:hypothetical protein
MNAVPKLPEKQSIMKGDGNSRKSVPIQIVQNLFLVILAYQLR